MKNKAARKMIDRGWTDDVPNFPYPTVSIGGLRGELYQVCKSIRISMMDNLKTVPALEVASELAKKSKFF